MKRSILILTLCCASVFCRAEGIAALKTLCPESAKMTIGSSHIVSGVVVSDCSSQNMAFNPVVNYKTTDVKVNNCTAYLQEEDGSAGVCLVFEHLSFNALHQFDRITVDLKGCTLTHDTNPDRVKVEGLTSFNVISYDHGEPLIPKAKTISKLCDEDIYTLVQLKNVEMLCKGSSYADVLESQVQYVPSLHKGLDYTPNNQYDCWLTLLRDGYGGHIYMMVNTLCPWRRTGQVLPQGKGDVVGVVDFCPMRRFGGDTGRYSIRPLDENGILISRKTSSNWTRLAGWELDGTEAASLKFLSAGVVDGLDKKGRLGDKVYNTTGSGKGLLWCDCAMTLKVGSCINSPSVEDKGILKCSSLQFNGASANWFPEGGEWGAIYVDVDASKISGKIMTFNLAWYGGNTSSQNVWGFPTKWRVECSLDGKSWVVLKDAVTQSEQTTLLSLPMYTKSIKGLGKRLTPYDSALGVQMHSYIMPAEVFGHQDVYVRLIPADSYVFTIRQKASATAIEGYKYTPEKKQKTTITLSLVSVDYR